MKKKLMAMLMAATLTVSMTSMGMTEVHAGEQTEITWLHHFQEQGIQKWIDEMITDFEAENPDIKVNTEVVLQDVFDQTLKTKIASDDAPMIFDLQSLSYYKEYGDAGHLYDLADLEGIENIDPTSLMAAQVDGHQWGVPLDVNAYAVHYNKQMFDELGLEIPTTLDEFRAVCDTLLENGITPMATPMAEQWCLMCIFDLFLCPLVDGDDWWTNKMNLTSSFAGDEGFAEAFEKYFSLKPYWGDDPFGTNYDTAQNMFANGEAAMLINGSWTVDGIASKNPDIEVRIFGMPTSDDDPAGVRMQLKPGSGLCLYNSSDEAKMEAGKKFFNYLLSEKSGNSYASNAFKMSTVKGVDFSFSPALMDVMAYPDEEVWNSAGVTVFSSEYEQLFYETITNFSMEDEVDIEELAESLDADFAAISN